MPYQWLKNHLSIKANSGPIDFCYESCSDTIQIRKVPVLTISKPLPNSSIPSSTIFQLFPQSTNNGSIVYAIWVWFQAKFSDRWILVSYKQDLFTMYIIYNTISPRGKLVGNAAMWCQWLVTSPTRKMTRRSRQKRVTCTACPMILRLWEILLAIRNSICCRQLTVSPISKIVTIRGAKRSHIRKVSEMVKSLLWRDIYSGVHSEFLFSGNWSKVFFY